MVAGGVLPCWVLLKFKRDVRQDWVVVTSLSDARVSFAILACILPSSGEKYQVKLRKGFCRPGKAWVVLLGFSECDEFGGTFVEECVAGYQVFSSCPFYQP